MLKKLIFSFIDIKKLFNSFLTFPLYILQLFKYKKIFPFLRIKDLYPQLNDNTSFTSIDKHYFYQDIWAFKKIFESKTKIHIDVGSNNLFVGLLTVITKVKFIDIRPLDVTLNNFENQKGTILNLPFNDSKVLSLSCLHVAEHIGLGRYGDILDIDGTIKACKELTRVLAENGNLYFSLPIGIPKICFNAHRIHNSDQILSYFKDLKLISFSGVDDMGNYYENINVDSFDDQNYCCGFFHFTK